MLKPESNSVTQFDAMPIINLTGIGLKERLIILNLFIMALDAILQWGDLEHTSDWDPYLVIHTEDGHSIETESGYSECELNTEKNILCIVDAGDSPDHPEYWNLNVMDIKTIKLYR